MLVGCIQSYRISLHNGIPYIEDISSYVHLVCMTKRPDIVEWNEWCTPEEELRNVNTRHDENFIGVISTAIGCLYLDRGMDVFYEDGRECDLQFAGNYIGTQAMRPPSWRRVTPSTAVGTMKTAGLLRRIILSKTGDVMVEKTQGAFETYDGIGSIQPVPTHYQTLEDAMRFNALTNKTIRGVLSAVDGLYILKVGKTVWEKAIGYVVERDSECDIDCPYYSFITDTCIQGFNATSSECYLVKS